MNGFWRALCPLVLAGWASGCLLTLESIHYRPRADVVASADGNHADGGFQDRVRTDADAFADIPFDGPFADQSADVLGEDAAVADEDAIAIEEDATVAEDVADEDAFTADEDVVAVEEDATAAEDVFDAAVEDVAFDAGMPDVEPDIADATDATDAVDATDTQDVIDVPVVDVPVDIPIDVPPPPPVLIQFRNGTDVTRLGDYWIRTGHTDTTLGAWSSGHCVGGITTLPGPDNWSQCELDVPLSPGDVLDFYPVFSSGTEVCGYGGSCPSPYVERFNVMQGARVYSGAGGAISFQRETVAGHVYQFLRTYL